MSSQQSGVKLVTLPEVEIKVAGQAKAASLTKLLVYSASIQSIGANSGTQYIGDSSVTSDNGQEFAPGDVAEIEGPPSKYGQEQFDLSEIHLQATASGTKFRISAWVRK